MKIKQKLRKAMREWLGVEDQKEVDFYTQHFKRRLAGTINDMLTSEDAVFYDIYGFPMGELRDSLNKSLAEYVASSIPCEIESLIGARVDEKIDREKFIDDIVKRIMAKQIK